MVSQLQACAALERRIRAASQEGKTVFHPELRQLRNELKQACEAALFEDYARAQRHDLEPLLWKSVFYRPIEEFRRRIKEHAASGNEDLLSKTRAAFTLYLQDASQFYTQLASKLQAAYGDVGFQIPGEQGQQQQQAQAQQEQQQGGPRHDCRQSVYRCLICLGDLARYQVGNISAQQRDWTECKRWYREAARVYPQGGNALNQLAVLASHEQDELAAVFYYLGALNVPSPFAVARENLVTALDTNRTSYSRLQASAAAAGAGGRGGGAAGPLPTKGTRPAAVLERELRIRWARVLGILHLKLDLDAFPDFLAAALSDLDDYLLRLRQRSKGTIAGAGAGAGGKATPGRGAIPATAAAAAGGDASAADESPPLLLMLALCVLCTAHSALAEHAQHAGTGASYASSLQRSVVMGYALTTVAELAGRLAGTAAAMAPHAAGVGAAGAGVTAAANEELLPPLSLLVRWAAGPLPAQSQTLVPAPVSGAGSSAGGASAEQPAILLPVLRRLWSSCAQLVAALGPAAAAAGAATTNLGGAGTNGGLQPEGEGQLEGVGDTGVASQLLLPEDCYCQYFSSLLSETPLETAKAGAAPHSTLAAGPAVASGCSSAPGSTSLPLLSTDEARLLRVLRVLRAARALAGTYGPGEPGSPLAAFCAAVESSSGGGNNGTEGQQAPVQAQQQQQREQAQQQAAVHAQQQQQQQQREQAQQQQGQAQQAAAPAAAAEQAQQQEQAQQAQQQQREQAQQPASAGAAAVPLAAAPAGPAAAAAAATTEAEMQEEEEEEEIILYKPTPPSHVARAPSIPAAQPPATSPSPTPPQAPVRPNAAAPTGAAPSAALLAARALPRPLPLPLASPGAVTSAPAAAQPSSLPQPLPLPLARLGAAVNAPAAATAPLPTHHTMPAAQLSMHAVAGPTEVPAAQTFLQQAAAVPPGFLPGLALGLGQAVAPAEQQQQQQQLDQLPAQQQQQQQAQEQWVHLAQQHPPEAPGQGTAPSGGPGESPLPIALPLPPAELARVQGQQGMQQAQQAQHDAQQRVTTVPGAALLQEAAAAWSMGQAPEGPPIPAAPPSGGPGLFYTLFGSEAGGSRDAPAAELAATAPGQLAPQQAPQQATPHQAALPQAQQASKAWGEQTAAYTQEPPQQQVQPANTMQERAPLPRGQQLSSNEVAQLHQGQSSPQPAQQQPAHALRAFLLGVQQPEQLQQAQQQPPGPYYPAMAIQATQQAQHAQQQSPPPMMQQFSPPPQMQPQFSPPPQHGQQGWHGAQQAQQAQHDLSLLRSLGINAFGGRAAGTAATAAGLPPAGATEGSGYFGAAAGGSSGGGFGLGLGGTNPSATDARALLGLGAPAGLAAHSTAGISGLGGIGSATGYGHTVGAQLGPVPAPPASTAYEGMLAGGGSQASLFAGAAGVPGAGGSGLGTPGAFPGGYPQQAQQGFSLASLGLAAQQAQHGQQPSLGSLGAFAAQQAQQQPPLASLGAYAAQQVQQLKAQQAQQPALASLGLASASLAMGGAQQAQQPAGSSYYGFGGGQLGGSGHQRWY